MPDSPTLDNFAVDNHLKRGGTAATAAAGGNAAAAQRQNPNSGLTSPVNETGGGAQALPPQARNQRQKSLDMMEQPPNEGDPASRGMEKRPNSAVPAASRNQINTPEEEAPPPNDDNAGDQDENDSGCGDDSPPADGGGGGGLAAVYEVTASNESAVRPSISNENNILLDPEVLNDQVGGYGIYFLVGRLI